MDNLRRWEYLARRPPVQHLVTAAHTLRHPSPAPRPSTSVARAGLPTCPRRASPRGCFPRLRARELGPGEVRAGLPESTLFLPLALSALPAAPCTLSALLSSPALPALHMSPPLRAHLRRTSQRSKYTSRKLKNYTTVVSIQFLPPFQHFRRGMTVERMFTTSQFEPR